VPHRIFPHTHVHLYIYIPPHYYLMLTLSVYTNERMYNQGSLFLEPYNIYRFPLSLPLLSMSLCITRYSLLTLLKPHHTHTHTNSILSPSRYKYSSRGLIFFCISLVLNIHVRMCRRMLPIIYFSSCS